EWLPLVTRFAVARVRGRHRFLAQSPTAGAVLAPAGSRAVSLRRPAAEAPPQLRDVRIVGSGSGDRAIGALAERGGRRLTAVVACRVAAFALLDHEAQERRLARWGLVLSGGARGAGCAVRGVA